MSDREPLASGMSWKLYHNCIFWSLGERDPDDYEKYLDARAEHHGYDREHLSYGDDIAGSPLQLIVRQIYRSSVCGAI